ncbi:MAG: DEAD/DEAH box helicase [Deltaproteobacteria bacterium]|nr:DEAD/DEAH box helicase [Deltaproteobacteria bacterium]
MYNKLQFISLNIPNDNRANLKDLSSYIIEEKFHLQSYPFYNEIENVSHLRKAYISSKNSYYRLDTLRLANTLLFHFANGNTYNIFEIFNFGITGLLPQGFLPPDFEKYVNPAVLKENTKLASFLNSLFHENRIIDFYIIANAILILIENAFKLADILTEKEKFKIYLSSGFNPANRSIKLLPVYSFTINEHLKEDFILGPTADTFSERSFYSGGFSLWNKNTNPFVPENLYFINNSFYNLDTKELTIIPILSTENKIRNQLNYWDFDPDMDSETAEQSGNIRIQKFTNLNPILSWLNKEKISYEYSNSPQLISSNKAHPVLSLNTLKSPHELTFAIKVSSDLNSFYLMNFLEDIRFFSQGFLDGMSAFFYEDRSELASGKKNFKREMDLKFLRHRGIASLILLETMNYYLGDPSSDGTSIKSEDELIEFLNVKCAVLLKVDGLPLKMIISKKVYSYLKSSILHILERLNLAPMTFTSPGEVIILENEKIIVAQFAKVILESYLSIDKGMASIKVSLKENETLIKSLFQKNTDILLLNDKESSSLAKTISKYLRKEQFHKIELEPKHGMELLKQIPYLLSKGWQIAYDDHDVVTLTADEVTTSIEFNDDNLDWFELHPKIFFNGMNVNIDEFKFQDSMGMVLFKGKYYLLDPKTLPKMKSLERFWKKISNKKNTPGHGEKKEFYRLPKSEILELLSLHHRGVKVESSSALWNKILNYYLNLNAQKNDLFINKKLTKILKPYQIEGIQWVNDLFNLQLGGILADDMGLGKTLQTLSFFEHLSKLDLISSTHASGKLNLILMPTSLVFNWIHEAKKFTPNLNLIHFNSQKKEIILKELCENTKKSVHVLITYGVLCENIEILKKIKWQVIVFDEAQYLKNISSYRATCARQLHGDFKLALTGTPLENNYMEFYSIADLILPGCLGQYETFNQIYGVGKNLTKEDLEDLKLKIKPILLRRTKDKLNIHLPQKHEKSIVLEFEKEQLEIYKKLALSHNDQINELLLSQGEGKSQLAMLTALLRLRQTCSDPNNLPKIFYNKVSPKLEHLIDSIKELIENNQSVLIFTQFLTTLERIHSLLKEAGICCLVINGAIPQNKRKMILEEFDKSEQPMVLAMTLKTGGVGLNLTKASTVFHVEPWWNPAVENQATDRVHRLGQTKNVEVYRLIMKNSVEEKIESLKSRKKGYFDSLFSESEDITTSVSGRLTKEDFLFLIQ